MKRDRIFMGLEASDGKAWFDLDDVMALVDVGPDRCKVYMGDGSRSFEVTYSAQGVFEKMLATYEKANQA